MTSRSAIPLALALVVCAASPSGQESVPPIRVDQAGYRPGLANVAILVGDTDAPQATVRDRQTGRVVAMPDIGLKTRDAQSGDTVRRIDLTEVTAPGSYVVEIPGAGASDPFRIDRDVYRRPLYLALRAFYGQRCGTAVDLGPEFAGFTHAACHLEDARFHPSSGRTGRVSATRGWHDAGDYGKYIVNSGIATGQLLWAWELFPESLRNLRLDIPESSNAIPDILDEIRWNLDWMLTMQDRDGGVWQKLTSERFGSFVMPEHDDGGPRYVIGTGAAPFKSTCATADFAAVMAIASRAYQPFDRGFAHAALDAARRAFTWGEAHADVRFRNPAGVSTGEYGDADCRDERLWAAAELFRTTGDASYNVAVRALEADFHVGSANPQNWGLVSNMGLWAYALTRRADADATLQQRIRVETLQAAEAVAARTAASGWRHALTDTDFVWGSNGVAANYGVLLLVADRFERRPGFIGAAVEHLHYLFGRNTFGVSWVTAVGTRPYRHPHHRPSGGDRNDQPWPGMLSGGPLAKAADPVMAKRPPTPPARGYVDDEGAYSANEMAINWNSALVLLLAGVQ